MMAGMMSSLRTWFDGLGKQQKWFVALLVFSLISTAALFGVGSASSVTSDPLDSTPFYFLSAFVKLIGVLVLIVGVSVIFRRWIQPGVGINSTRQLKLVETIRLSPRQALHLVMVGNQKLLIGATDQSVSLIAPIEEDVPDFPVDGKFPHEPGLEFGPVLQSFNFSFPSEKADEKNEGSHV